MIEQVCRDINDGVDCDSSDVSSRASLVAIGVILAQGIPSFVLNGFYGLLSVITRTYQCNLLYLITILLGHSWEKSRASYPAVGDDNLCHRSACHPVL